MMKKFFFIQVIVLFFLSGCGSLFESYSKKIVILYPIAHPSLENIKEAFKITVAKKFPEEKIQFIEYNGSGNRLLMHQQSEQAILQKPDLIFAIATSSAGLITAASLRYESQIPLVCGAADIELITVNGKLPAHTACVFDLEDYEKQLDLLSVIRPACKHLMIVYDQNATKNQHDLDRFIMPLADKKNITVSTLPVGSVDEMHKKVPLFLQSTPDVDAIMIFKDSLIVSGIEILVKVCNEKGITLYTSDIDSVARGAAAGFGVEEAMTGIESGKLACHMLVDLKKEYEPVIVKSDILLINPETMQQQGLSVTDEQLKKTELGYQFIDTK